MELDRSALDRILTLDDKSLSELAQKIASAAGADPRRTAEMLKNLDFIRGTIAKMSPEEADKLIRTAGREKSEQILGIINGKESG